MGYSHCHSHCGCSSCCSDRSTHTTFNTVHKHFYGREITKYPSSPVGCFSVPNTSHNHSCNCVAEQVCEDKVLPSMGILQCGETCPDTTTETETTN